MAEVHLERRGTVAILTMDRPVANALAPSLRSELLTTLEAALADDQVTAIVLRGAGPGFSSGADVTEYDGALSYPWIDDLCQKIETSPKPVVAALHGAALGGGFELALAAHLRVAAQDARVALPEVKLGLIPGGGATQRVPRMIGAQAALELMLSGQSVAVTDPRLKHLIDTLVPGDPLEPAIAAAAGLARAGSWRRGADHETGFSDPQAYQNALAVVGGRLGDTDSAEADILRCVEVAMLLPYENALAFERVAFEDRRVSAKARALRHCFAAERRASIMPEMAQGKAAEVSQVAILGAGDLVTELAAMCLSGGLRVSLITVQEAEAEAVRDKVSGIFDMALMNEQVSVAEREARMGRLVHDRPSGALARADLILDTGQVPMDDAMGQPRAEAVWAMLTGDVEATFEPPQEGAMNGQIVGLKVYRPAHVAMMAELAVPQGTRADAVVTVAQLLSRLGCTAIRCAPISGLVGNNLVAALYEAALVLAEAGAAPEMIDAGACALGFDAGPFRMMDREGLAWISDRLHRRAEVRARPAPPREGVLAGRVGAGALGAQGGRGFYVYEGGTPQPDPDLVIGQGPAASLSEAELGAALGVALANEAAHLLSEGVVARASDMDLVMIKGYAFDRASGGPLLRADLSGMLSVLQYAKRFSALSAPIWAPHPMIEDMFKNGEGFFGRAP